MANQRTVGIDPGVWGGLGKGVKSEGVRVVPDFLSFVTTAKRGQPGGGSNRR